MQYQVNTKEYSDAKADGGGHEPGAYFYKITNAEVKTGKTSGKEYISYEMTCGLKGEPKGFDLRFLMFFPNSEKMRPIFDSFLITAGKSTFNDVSELVGLTGMVVLRKRESISKGEIGIYLDEVVSFFDTAGLSAEEKMKKEPSKKLELKLKFVHENPVKMLSAKEKEGFHDTSTQPAVPPGQPGPTAGMDDSELPF